MDTQLGALCALAMLFACDKGTVRPGTESNPNPISADGAPNARRDASQAATDDGAASPPAPIDSGGGKVPAGQDSGTRPPNNDASANVPPAGKVPAFVAVGHCTRRILSCDGGKSWIRDVRSEGCSQDQWWRDHSDHASSALHSVDYGNGVFLANWGWGEPGAVLRTRDGITWEPTSVSDTEWFGGTAYGGGRWLLGRQDNGRTSTDDTQSFQPLVEQAGFRQGFTNPNLGLARATYYVAGRFVMVGDQDLWTTVTGNNDFAHVQENGCFPRSFAEGNGVVVGVLRFGDSDYLCRSTDQLASMNKVKEGGIRMPVVFAQGKFHYWSQGNHFTSTDGASWTSVPIQGGYPGASDDGVVAFSSATNTYAAINSHWDNANAQEAYYSSDGTSWTEVDIPVGPGLRSIAAGFVDASGDCPAP